ncbi:hypothetical protein E5676_scaffold162G00150 [Cucumis melo var. makuwa]|uniref:Uncharacterized protein n=1 Tax=Cucumis melo var. makuwa TaxID=1194695 RepID=A0A5D3DJR0_CUCMM|nr:hypothetical protein E5676_scaffold162G00150 [Cucumis melo var. makuwa]
MIRVIRRDRSQPDYLSVSSEYATDQFVLGVPLVSSKTRFCSYGITCWTCSGTWAEVRARASWRATRSDRGEP